MNHSAVTYMLQYLLSITFVYWIENWIAAEGFVTECIFFRFNEVLQFFLSLFGSFESEAVFVAKKLKGIFN